MEEESCSCPSDYVFRVSFKGLESDDFQNTGNCEEAQILRNIEDRILMAQPMDQTDAATFETITIRAMEKGMVAGSHLPEV